METTQMVPFLHLIFSALTVLILISEFENTQNPLLPVPYFGSFWSVKYLNSWPKASDSDSSLDFSGKSTP